MNRTILRISLLLIVAFFGFKSFAQPCENGMSGDFPCDMVDQIAHRDLDFFNQVDANDIWGWTSPATGREYVMLGLHNRTAFLDITSPKYPIYLGYLPTATVGSIWRDIKVVGHYAYIVSEASFHGLQIFDLNRLEDLSVIDNLPVQFDMDAYYNAFGHCHNIVADTANGFVYPVGTGLFEGGLYAIDVSDPLNVQYAGSNSIGGYVHDAQAFTYEGPDSDYNGRQIVVGFNEDHMVVYDATDKTDIGVISQSTYENVGYTHQGWFTEDRHYLLSNDETDEVDYGIPTRTIIWDMSNLDNPQVVSYAELGTVSIDHNLYIKGDMVYESNYSSGLRILDLLEIGDGILHPFGYFDVYPQTDLPFYEGTWSNYPYFKSGVIPVSGISSGLHLVKPRFFELDSEVVRVCSQETVAMDIKINRRFLGPVNYSVLMENTPGLDPQLGTSQTDGAPAQNTLTLTGLSTLAPGSYPGEVVITNNGNETRLPFVLVKANPFGNTPDPEIISPNNVLLPNQLVDFNFNDSQPGYGILQVALDQNFENIVFEHEYFNSGTTFSAQMPFNQTTYFWRIIEPDPCGDFLYSNVGTFTIDEATRVASAKMESPFRIFPNPAEDFIQITGLDKRSENIQIYDITGRMVLQKQTNTTDTPEIIRISELKSGVYLVRIDGRAGGEKFVKD